MLEQLRCEFKSVEDLIHNSERKVARNLTRKFRIMAGGILTIALYLFVAISIGFNWL